MENKINKKDHAVSLWALIILTAFLGQLDIRPFSDQFRFSFSVPALSLILLYFPNTSPLLYSAVASLVMFVLRVLIAAASSPGEGTFLMHLSMQSHIVAFYLIFGGLFSLVRVRKNINHGVMLFFSLLLCELMANMAELFLIHQASPQPLEKAIFFIVCFGIVRSAATASIYRLSIYWQVRHDRQEREANYQRMLVFFSGLKADIMFFRKSMDDIEKAMKCSYSLYEKLKNDELSVEALTVSRLIHEVKKEYQRLIASMEKILAAEYVRKPIYLSQIFDLFKTSLVTLAAAQNIKANVVFRCDGDWVVEHDYIMISIINNLTINAMEAIRDKPGGHGLVEVSARPEGDMLMIEIKDDGPGIDEDLLDLIFEPGFSTKYNPATGEMSTGLGLTHVKSILENHCDGKILVDSSSNGTSFRIIMAAHKLHGVD